MKTIAVEEADWEALCRMKFTSRAKSLSEVIARLLNAHQKDVLSQKSLLKEGERYE